MEQENKKSNKKKLVVAIALLALIVVASVVTTVVLVLAAQQQAATSNVHVTYTVKDVSAKVELQYNKRFVSESGAALTTGTIWGTTNDDGFKPTTLTALEFAASENQTTKTQDATTTIELDSVRDYVVFEYKITNYSQEQDLNVWLSYIDDNTADSNVDCYYQVSTTQIPSFASDDDFKLARATATDPYTWTEYEATAKTAPVLTGAGATDATAICSKVGGSTTTQYIYVVVAINDLTTKADFSGTFHIDLRPVVVD